MRVVARALSVISLLGNYTRGLTLQEMHNRLEIPLGSLHRILATLVTEEFIFRSPINKRYYLGSRATALSKAQNYDSFVVPPPTALTDAAQESGETVFLTQLIDKRIVCVSLVEARHSLRLTVDIGESVPLETAASARVILAHLDTPVLETVLHADAALAGAAELQTTVPSLPAHLASVRERGFDFCAGELDEGVWAVAAPVFNANGEIALGITLAAAATRMATLDDKARALDVVMRAAETLSRQNGFPGAEKPRPNPRALLRAFGQAEDSLTTPQASA